MKNRSVFMRTAGVMLVLCLVLSCTLFGTMAKYTSSLSGAETGTVASWKINVGPDGEKVDISSADPENDTIAFNLFSTVNDTGNTAAEGDIASVVGTNLIAPGTAGSFDIKIENASQVNAKYTVALAETNTNVPLRYSVDGTNYVDSIAELTMTALTDNEIAMNATETVTVYWMWGYNGGHADQTDGTDTALGVAAQTAPATVTITATVSATQVD